VRSLGRKSGCRSQSRAGSVRAARAVLAIAIPCALALSPGGVRATPFSSAGWGWWWDVGDPAALGRGGTSVAVRSYGASADLNPATIALAERGYGFTSYAGEIADSRGGDGDPEGSFRQKADLLPRLGGVIELPRGLRAGGSFSVQSDGTYERAQRYAGDVTGPYELKTKGMGGLHRIQVALAGSSLDRRLLWGVSVGRVQGSVKEFLTYNFDDAEERDQLQVVRARLRGGAVATGGVLLLPTEGVAVGASGTLGGSSRLIQEVEVLRTGDYDASWTGRQELPDRWAAGVELRPIKRLGLSADLIRTLWSEAALRAAPGGASRRPFHDTTRWGAGLEYDFVRGEIPQWTIRGGVSGSSHHVRAVDPPGAAARDDAAESEGGSASGKDVRETVASVGLRRLVAKNRAAVDLAIEWGKRGDAERVGLEESFARVSLGITFSSTQRDY